MEAALVAECWQLPEALRHHLAVDIQVSACRRLAIELLQAAELPREFAEGGFVRPPSAETELVAVVERTWKQEQPELVHKRSRYFHAEEPWMAVRRSDMSPVTPAFRPGADTLVSDVVRQTAPGQPYSEEVAALSIDIRPLSDDESAG